MNAEVLPPDDPREEPESPGGDLAVVGESPGGGHKVSMQILQDIYSEITGKSEELGKQYSGPFCVEFSDFQNLDAKLNQALEQYNVRASNLTVKVYYEEDSHDTFSSFDRFAASSQASTHPVESVLLKYNFMIVLPKTNRVQSYTVSVRVVSKLTALRGFQKRLAPIPKEVARIIGGPTGAVSIDYVDYTVARNFLNIVDGWFQTLDEADTPRPIRWIKKSSSVLVSGAEYLWVVGSLLLALSLMFRLVDQGDVRASSSFLLVALIAVYTSGRIGRLLGRSAEDAILDWQELASIKLNKGDDKEIATARKNNKDALIMTSLSLGASLLVGIIASLIANWLFSG